METIPIVQHTGHYAQPSARPQKVYEQIEFLTRPLEMFNSLSTGNEVVFSLQYVRVGLEEWVVNRHLKTVLIHHRC